MDRRWVAFIVIGLAVLGVVAVLGVSVAQDEPLLQVVPLAQGEPVAPIEQVAVANQPVRVVAALPTESITEYEPDPFEPQRVRSSTVRVRRVALVYSDGSIEVDNSP